MTADETRTFEVVISVDTSGIRAALAGVGVSDYRTPEQHRAVVRRASASPPFRGPTTRLGEATRARLARAFADAYRTMAPGGLPDTLAHDATPDRCWRCDAREGAGDIGLCGPCHTDLVG